MRESFIIGAYWGSRAEQLSQVADNSLETLIKLGQIDEQFLHWYELGISRSQSLEKQALLTKETLEKLCLQKVKKGELDGNGNAKMGFLFSLWTGHKDEESSAISFSVGAQFNTDKLSNSVVIKVPYEGKAKDRLLETSTAKMILELLISIWKPDYAVLTSETLRDKLGVGNRIGWITYRKSIKKAAKSSEKINYEKLDGGHWFFFKHDEGIYNSTFAANEFKTIKEII